MAASSPLSVGSTFGPYRIDAVLGRGGMGVVYRAEDRRLARPVALKLLAEHHAADAHFRDRFLRESRLAAAIEHPGVVPIYEAAAVDGTLYIAMRYVDGRDLGALLTEEGRLDPERAVAIVEQLADALDAAHARGLIHRDVKPSNAIVADERGRERIYLVDFGITRDLGSDESLTETGAMVGTVDYLAPERIRGGTVDGRADVYSLGCRPDARGRRPRAARRPLPDREAQLRPCLPGRRCPGTRARRVREGARPRTRVRARGRHIRLQQLSRRRLRADGQVARPGDRRPRTLGRPVEVVSGHGPARARDLRAILGTRVDLMAADGFGPPAALFDAVGEQADGVCMSFNGVAMERLPRAGRRFVAALARTQPGIEVEPFALA